MIYFDYMKEVYLSIICVYFTIIAVPYFMYRFTARFLFIIFRFLFAFLINVCLSCIYAQLINFKYIVFCSQYRGEMEKVMNGSNQGGRG